MIQPLVIIFRMIDYDYFVPFMIVYCNVNLYHPAV
jgi:hypothetical protein